MLKYSNIRLTARRRLLATAGIVLVTALGAMPASAQVSATHAEGARALISEQLSRAALVHAKASSAGNPTLIGAVRGADVTLAGNIVRAAARANDVTSALASEDVDAYLAVPSTRLVAGHARIEAEAGDVAAITQRTVGSAIVADGSGARFTLRSGDEAGASIKLSRNVAAAEAIANDALGAIELGGSRVDAGAGIASAQLANAATTVTANTYALTQLTAGYVTDSQLAIEANSIKAFSSGNSAQHAMSVSAATIGISAGSAAGSTAMVQTDGDAEVSAAFSLLGDQRFDGNVAAIAGGLDSLTPFGALVVGDLTDASLVNDSNVLAASAQGNRSSNGTAIDSASLRGASPSEGLRTAVGNVTNVQRIGAAHIDAATEGGNWSYVIGDVRNSSLMGHANETRVDAVGNLAEANRLQVNALQIDASAPETARGPAATAQTGNDGTVTADAAFSTQNIQDYGLGSITARSAPSDVLLEVYGAVDRSVIRDDGNVSATSATGNSARNDIALRATQLRASAAVHNVQMGNGDVLVASGSTTYLAGATIAPMGQVLDSQLSVTGNRTTGIAVGNAADSSLTVAADTILPSSKDHGSVAGTLPNGYGAAADFAINSFQRIGQPVASDGTRLRIVSDVNGRFGITGDQTAQHSTLTISGNSQRSDALANSAVNTGTVTASRLGENGVPAAATALTSSQYGEASVVASSYLKLASKGAIDGSSAVISDNANLAFAAMNEVDNLLELDAAHADAGSGEKAVASVGASPAITGVNVIANLQFAAGAVASSARTRTFGVDTGVAAAPSRFAVEDNTLVAEASANRARNAIDISVITGPPAAGIASLQTSVASVQATATSEADYSLGSYAPGAGTGTALLSIGTNTTSALARGNVIDNRLTSGFAGSPAVAAMSRADTSLLGSTVQGDTVLLSAQTNYGGISASAIVAPFGTPLNQIGAAATGSAFALNGNRATAEAFGNAASNMIAVPAHLSPFSSLANIQVNYGPVSAQVSGTGFATMTGSLSASSLAITGNELAATAIGNQANNILTTSR